MSDLTRADAILLFVAAILVIAATQPTSPSRRPAPIRAKKAPQPEPAPSPVWAATRRNRWDRSDLALVLGVGDVEPSVDGTIWPERR